MARVMVLDADATVRRFLAILLESMGHEVTVTGGAGTVAIERLQADPRAADIIIADTRIAIASGFEVLEYVRSRGLAASVVLVSTLWMPEEVLLARDLGVTGVLQKPFEVKAFLDLVAQAEEQVRRFDARGRALRPETQGAPVGGPRGREAP